MTGIAIAGVWFALSAGLTGFAAVNGVRTLISASLDGCVMIIDGRRVQFTESRDVACMQRVDLVPLVLAAVACVLLLATLAWLGGRRGTRLSRLVPFGAVAAVLVGLVPFAFVVWAIDFYRLALGPGEIAMSVIPFVWAVGSALVALRAWRRERLGPA